MKVSKGKSQQELVAAAFFTLYIGETFLMPGFDDDSCGTGVAKKARRVAIKRFVPHLPKVHPKRAIKIWVFRRVGQPERGAAFLILEAWFWVHFGTDLRG